MTAGIANEEIPATRRAILEILKAEGSATIAELAEALGISYEAARQQITQTLREGWTEPHIERSAERTAGRPKARYSLTEAGEHLFPKGYDLLSVELIDAVTARFGTEGLSALLADLSETRVRRWAPQLAGLSLEERLEAVKGIYLDQDPFMTVVRGEDGDWRLVERNCPFLNVASERPALCSLTVATLSRLLGYQVVREERFQEGAGRCVFRVLSDRPLPAGEKAFELEPEGTTE